MADKLQNFIDGHFVPAHGEKTLDIVDPATGRTVAVSPVSNLGDGTVAKSIDLPQTPVELAVTTGKPHGAGAASGEGHDHGPEGHHGEASHGH